MKHCPRCNRNYADEALSYCLEDGAVLVGKYDADATLVNPYPPQPVVPPTIAYQRTPATQPVVPVMPAYAAVVQEPRRRSSWTVGALVLLALGLGLTIGAIIFQRSNKPSTTAPSVKPAENPVVAITPLPNPTPDMIVPKVVAPDPAPTPSNNVKSTTVQEPECFLFNDKNDKSRINVRMNCDTRNCDSDKSTIAGDYPDNTPVRVIRGVSVPGERFTWIKVIITSSGQTVWVASAKVKCT